MINMYSSDDFADGNFAMYNLDSRWDLSEYDGIVVDVAAENDMTMKLLLNDERWRWPKFMMWEGLFEVKGGLEQQTIYVPFKNFYPTTYGFSAWPYRFIPFKGLQMSTINNIGYQYCIFEYISWFG